MNRGDSQRTGTCRAIEAIPCASIEVSGQVTCLLIGGESMEAYLPASLALNHTRRHFEQAIWTVPCYDFFYCASWTADLLAVFAKKEVLKRV